MAMRRLKSLIALAVVGWIVLLGAIAANYLAGRLGLMSWYEVFAGGRPDLVSCLWLALGYPIVLGLSAAGGRYLAQLRWRGSSDAR